MLLKHGMDVPFPVFINWREVVSDHTTERIENPKYAIKKNGNMPSDNIPALGNIIYQINKQERLLKTQEN